MTTINLLSDCGNSSKNTFLQDFTIAFARADADFLLGSVTDDFRWNIVGGKNYEGKGEFAAAIEKMEAVAEITIQHVATHGKAGAVDGIMKTKNGKTLSFCDVVDFSNSKGDGISAITTYVIEVS